MGVQVSNDTQRYMRGAEWVGRWVSASEMPHGLSMAHEGILGWERCPGVYEWCYASRIEGVGNSVVSKQCMELAG